MTRFFFDVHGHTTTRDDEGTELTSYLEAAQEAKKLLPQIAAEEVPEDGEQQSFTVLVTDEDGHPIYSATLAYVGTWLIR